MDTWSLMCSVNTPCISFLALYRSSRSRSRNPLLVSWGAGQRYSKEIRWQVNSRWTIIQARVPFTNRVYLLWLVKLYLGNNCQSSVTNCSVLCVIDSSQQAHLSGSCLLFVKEISTWIIMTDKKNQKQIQMKKSRRKKKKKKKKVLSTTHEKEDEE